MAKREENRLSRLQMPLPEGRKAYRVTKRSWSGLNYRQTIDSGALSKETNISTLETPYLVPAQKPELFKISGASIVYNHPIGLFGFEQDLFAFYGNGSGGVFMDVYRFTDGNASRIISNVTIQASSSDESPRCFVPFNVLDSNLDFDPLAPTYERVFLLFPDKKSIRITENNGTYTATVASLDVNIKEYAGAGVPPETASHMYYYHNTQTNKTYRWVDDESDSSNSGWRESVPPSFPPLRYAAVHLSRLFGVSGGRIYASGFNDYANWNLDTVEDYSESNAWCSTSQSNTKASGDFTGIAVFQNHIVCFKRDFMHELYNTKNPFRVQDIYAEGTIDNRTIQDVDGKLIFVSEDGVKVYTGSNPRIIDYELNLGKIDEAVSGTDDRCYYLYCVENENEHLFVYDTFSDAWSEMDVIEPVLAFAHNRVGMFMLCGDEEGGSIYRVDSGKYGHEWSFETDLITKGMVDIKHLKKIQMLCDIKSSSSNNYVDVYVLYDDEVFNSSTSQKVCSISGSGQHTVRVKVRMSAHYGVKLHVEGKGYARLYETELILENGGESYHE